MGSPICQRTNCSSSPEDATNCHATRQYFQQAGFSNWQLMVPIWLLRWSRQKFENSTTALGSTTWLPFCLCMKIQYAPYNMHMVWVWLYSDLYSLSRMTSCRQMSWSLEAAWLGVIMIVTLCNLAGNCCRGAYQISERLEKSRPESRGFEISRNLAVRRPSA